MITCKCLHSLGLANQSFPKFSTCWCEFPLLLSTSSNINALCAVFNSSNASRTVWHTSRPQNSQVLDSKLTARGGAKPIASIPFSLCVYRGHSRCRSMLQLNWHSTLCGFYLPPKSNNGIVQRGTLRRCSLENFVSFTAVWNYCFEQASRHARILAGSVIQSGPPVCCTGGNMLTVFMFLKQLCSRWCFEKPPLMLLVLKKALSTVPSIFFLYKLFGFQHIFSSRPLGRYIIANLACNVVQGCQIR